jgi:hypothetical protein
VRVHRSSLCHGPGDLLGEPVELNDEQRGWIYRMYEVHPEKLERGRISVIVNEPNPQPASAGFSGARCRCGRARARRSSRRGSPRPSCTPKGRCVAQDSRRLSGVRVPVGRGVTDPYIPMISYTEEQTEELAYGALRRILEKSDR